MKKSDLKTGMRVRMRDGSIHLVVLNVLIDGRNDILFTNDRGGWMPGESYNDDLICKSYDEFDIMEVYSIAENQRHFGSNFMTLDKRYSIWKRDELEPCPFCGQTEYIKVIRDSYVGSGYYAVCCSAERAFNEPTKGCGATSGYYPTKEEAMNKWNRREEVEK